MRTLPKHGAWAALAALTAGALPWQSTTLMAGMLAVCTAMSLLAEWQARGNLVTPTRVALTVRIVCGNATGGQTLRLTWTAEADRHRQQPGT
ncbi:hypothetical protein ACGFIK_25970 [Micromonospora sp. NPDC048871]|uniref:hypothetical protein n=1 Tax=Micromonospora sp. NPDC048871 TaxID=3364259 RepID=UPI00371F11A9